MPYIRLLSILLFLVSCSSTKNPNQKVSSEYPTERIIQSILDLKELNTYFYPKKQGRSPLVISNEFIPDKLTLLKFDQPVRILPKEKLGEAYLRFTRFDCKSGEFGDYCDVRFEYPIEKVYGKTGVFINPDGSHILEKTEIQQKK